MDRLCAIFIKFRKGIRYNILTNIISVLFRVLINDIIYEKQVI